MSRREIAVSEAARRLGVERQTAYRYIRQRRLPAHRVAGKLVVYADDLAKIEVEPPCTRADAPPEELGWTRAMTMKRLDEWNDAVMRGEFSKKDGSVSTYRITQFEKKHGWTHEALVAAVCRYEGKDWL